jgi:hypothetical protein
VLPALGKAERGLAEASEQQPSAAPQDRQQEPGRAVPERVQLVAAE